MDSFLSFHSSSPSIPSFPGANLLSSVKPPIEVPSLNGISPNIHPSAYSSGQRTRAGSFSTLSPASGYSPVRGGIAPSNVDISNLLALMKLQQNIQAEVFKQNVKRMLELKNSFLEKMNQQQLQFQSEPQTMKPSIPTISPFKEDVNSKVKIEAPLEEFSNLAPKIIQPSQRKALKAQIKEIINFVLDNFGRISEVSFEKEKLKYSHDQDLIAVFDMLTSKYASTIKTKEEMVKYTLRRAFKFIKNNLKKETNSNNKGVSRALCNKYFNASPEEMSKIGNEEEFLKVLLPFRKHSKNKTMNTTFINEVFASEEFCKDYQNYLKHFDNILETDNKNKIERFASFIEECIRKRKIKDIKGYKRIPWPKVWIVNTKNIAKNLPSMGNQVLSSPGTKKVKSETNFSSQNSSGTTEEFECCSEASTNSHSNY